jgi:high-affinity nickel-transport protein
VAQETNLSGGVWDVLENFNINRAGFIIVGVFVLTWIVALAVWRLGDIEAKWELEAAEAYAQSDATA